MKPPPGNNEDPPGDALRMQCMEVWGGNEFAEQQVELTGLDAWVYSRPHAQANRGGDVYYLSSCASGRISRLLIADVAGHGDSAGLVARSLRDLMRRNINYISQTRLVRSMNEQFTALSNEGRFATALVSTYFAPRGSLMVSTAGHPLPLHFQSATGTWSEVLHQRLPVERGAGLQDVPLGIFGQTSYRQVQLKVAPGDLLLCFTDGLQELPTGPNQLLGVEGLLKILNQLDPQRPGELIRSLLERVVGEVSAANQRDDITLVLLRPNGKAIPLLNSLRAPFRVVRDLFRRQP